MPIETAPKHALNQSFHINTNRKSFPEINHLIYILLTPAQVQLFIHFKHDESLYNTFINHSYRTKGYDFVPLLRTS